MSVPCEPIDPNTPIPEHCKAKKADSTQKDAGGDEFKKDTSERQGAPPREPRKKESKKVEGEL